MPASVILIVEDDPEIAAMISGYLREQGFVTEIEGRGDRAVGRILAVQPAAVVLDVMLPGKDGLTVCREVRRSYRGPILILTALGAEVDEVAGLELGADDYLAKPIRPRVLLARLRALLRRATASTSAGGGSVRIGELAVDMAAREACFRGQPIELTSGELDLLAVLASQAGQVVSRKALYQTLKGTEHEDFDRSIDLMVSRLRQKLREATADPDVIKTVRGVGYLYTRS
ncbi:MAG TPA: winged helix-turn-helix domain-containing protein [Kofleriaceae bacterium]|jgi:DNA-binding response OmpR family regulator|nr:winged helix-turn-helix domain-containing protein [Kofleriaceae bacterium]